MCELQAHEEPQRGLTGLIDNIVCAIMNARVYPAAHRRVREPAQAVVSGLREHFESDPSPSLEIHFSQGFVVTDGKPRMGLSLAARPLVEEIQGLGCGGISFARDTTSEDVVGLLQLLNAREKPAAQDIGRALEHGGVRRISLLFEHAGVAGSGPRNGPRTAGARGLNSADLAAVEELARTSVTVHQDLLSGLQTCCVDVASGRDLSMSKAQGDLEKALRGMRINPGSMLQASRYEQYDSFTFGHSVRVAILAIQTAQAFIRRDDHILQIGTAALFHDIGKVGLPFELLHFGGKLDDEQRREMNRHTELGAELLLASKDVDPVAVATALCHHEGVDRGYPLQVRPSRLSAVTRLVKICDIFEALTAPRPYKAAMPIRQAYSIMLSMGEALDRAMLRQFMSIHGLFPNGSTVELGGGLRAEVVEQTDDLLRPVVRPVDTDVLTGIDDSIDLRESLLRVVSATPPAALH